MAPVAIWKYPAGHSVHDDEPDTSVYVPTGHSEHSAIIIVPVVHVASNPEDWSKLFEVNTTSRTPVEEV